MPSHWLILSTTGKALHHTLRNDNGNWQKFWGDVIVAMKGLPDAGLIQNATFHTDLSGNLHVCVSTSLNNIWHTLRLPNGTWQQGWGNVKTASTGLPAGAVKALASSVSGDNTFQLFAEIGATIYHTLRQPSGTWQGSWGDVNLAVPGTPPTPIALLAGG